jgi:hypothetical protein
MIAIILGAPLDSTQDMNCSQGSTMYLPGDADGSRAAWDAAPLSGGYGSNQWSTSASAASSGASTVSAVR